MTIAVLGVMHIIERPGGDPGDAQSAERGRISSSHEPLRAFIAMGSVVLAVTGAEALYADMGHFGRKPIRVSWLYFVLPALLLNYMGQGAMILSQDPAQALADGQGPVLLPRSGHAAAAAGAARDRGDDHRQPGGDFGRLLGHPAGDPARLRPAPQDHPHQRKRAPGRSTSRSSTGR